MNTNKCPQCSAPLENTPSGQFSACPNGHGKLLPPIILKPFCTLEIPSKVAICPECDGTIEVECNEWTMVDGVPRATQCGLMIYCSVNSPFGDEPSEEEDHNYAQHVWIAVHRKVYKYLEAVE